MTEVALHEVCWQDGSGSGVRTHRDAVEAKTPREKHGKELQSLLRAHHAMPISQDKKKLKDSSELRHLLQEPSPYQP